MGGDCYLFRVQHFVWNFHSGEKRVKRDLGKKPRKKTELLCPKTSGAEKKELLGQGGMGEEGRKG